MTASANEIQAAARVVAHRILGNFVEDFELTGWGEYMPEASERAFDAVAVEMRAAVPPRPDYTVFAAATAALIADGAS